ncbi:MAG: M56 family metallopeptidase [Eubacteriales bacterium]|nr:M56 family metallopeptidase [Eubacteriales bacterium]
MTALYITTKHELKDSRHLRDNIYVSDKITSPVTYGIIRPRIILPKNYNDNDLKYILMHEQAHNKRLDNLWRIVAIVTACTHWFNPLSWLFLKVFLENLELACDEKVLKNSAEEDKKRYALTLINCAESKSLYASAFGGARVKVRIERILSYKKLSLFAVITFLVFASVIAYTLLTNAS